MGPGCSAVWHKVHRQLVPSLCMILRAATVSTIGGEYVATIVSECASLCLSHVAAWRGKGYFATDGGGVSHQRGPHHQGGSLLPKVSRLQVARI